MSSWVNYDDVRSQLLRAGLVLDRELDFDARIQRWKVEGEDRERRGWSRLKIWVSPKTGSTYIVGNYGVWHGNDDGMQRIDLPKRDDPVKPLTDEEVAAISAAQKESAKRIADERKMEAQTAAKWASMVWAVCQPAAEHDYLMRKQIQPHGTRILGEIKDVRLPGIDDANLFRLSHAAGALVVPMHNVSGDVCGLQFVYPKGHPRRQKIERDKEFWPSGMAMGGTFGLIGHFRRDGVMLVAEGFATAASLAEATGQSVVYAFSANNLAKAGKEIRRKYKNLRLLFCADDDYLTQSNPGCTAAADATAQIEHSAWIKPVFTGPDGADLRDGKKLTDFNDLLILSGLPAVLADQINHKLDELKWRDSISAAGIPQQGSGEGGAMPSALSIEEAVRRYWGTYGFGGKLLFDEIEQRLVHRDDVMNLLPPRSWDMLKQHPLWRVARDTEIGFDPTEQDTSIRCNLFGGWTTVPRRGRCDMLLELLRFLCSMEPARDELYEWIIRWLAYPLQHRGAKMHSAIVLHGPQGTGKSRFFEIICKIYGPYGRVLGQEALEDKFNADWAEKKLFILADEVLARQDMYHVKNRLKGFITGDSIRVNPKNVAAHTEKNQMNIVFLSNERQPLVLENDDRRHCVIWAPPKPDEAFFREVNEEIGNGGAAALHDYLLNLDLGDFKPWTKPPLTSAKQDLINLGKGSEERFVDEWVNGDLEHPVCPCASADLYRAYHKWCRNNGVSHPREMNQFIGYLGKTPGWVTGERGRVRVFKDLLYSGEPLQQRAVIPPENVLQKHKKNNTEGKIKIQWLTDCFLAFRETLDDRQ